MKEFKIDILRRNTTQIYDELNASGKVLITHSNRPRMVLMLERDHDDLVYNSNKAKG